MRTTLTLDSEVVELLNAEAHRQRKTFEAVVNDAIRRGLTGVRAEPRRSYAVRPHHTALGPGVDPHAMNRLADELEDDVLLRRSKGCAGSTR